MGVFLSDGKPLLISFIIFLSATTLLILHTLLFNDWAGHKINPAERTRVVLQQGESENIRPLATASIFFLFISTLFYAALEIRLLIPLSCWVILSFLYSHPAVHMKGKAGSSFLLHLLGGVVKFLLGYLLLSSDFPKGIMLALFFSLIFSAGSLVHQCLHESEDKGAALDTAAVRYGKRKVIVGAIVLFILSHAYLFVLSWTGWVAWKISLVLAMGLIAHFQAIIRLLSTPRDIDDDIKKYQRLYRSLYGLASMVIILWSVSR